MTMKRRSKSNERSVGDIELQKDDIDISSNLFPEMTTWQHFQEFSDNTSLHGVKYVGEKNRHLFERIWWTLMFIMSVIVCGFLISKVWEKWNNSPVIVSFAETSTPVWQVPFPAVTICPESKVRKTVFNFSEAVNNRENLTDEMMERTNKLTLVCDNEIFSNLNFSSIVTQDDVDYLYEVAPQFSQTIVLCSIFNEFKDCRTLLKPILTEEGICYTFNMLDSNFFDIDKVPTKNNETNDDIIPEYNKTNIDEKTNADSKFIWTLDGGYIKDAPEDVTPVRAFGSGIKNSIHFIMKANSTEFDFLCRDQVEGFKIMLHHPAETPRIDLPYFYVPLEQSVIAVVKPDMMTTANSLKSYTSQQRQCLFPHERLLKHHTVYTQLNCKLECITKVTLEKCGCVNYFMPRDNSTPICGPSNKQCMVKAQAQTLRDEASSNINSCNCLPACTSLQYNVETSQASLNIDAALKALDINLPFFQMSNVVIYFKEMQFIASRRSELYGLTDFLANCGGLLGLSMGFSILSLIEIIYFLTIRPLCNLGFKGHVKIRSKFRDNSKNKPGLA